jgi:hypothetical protein
VRIEDVGVEERIGRRQRVTDPSRRSRC